MTSSSYRSLMAVFGAWLLCLFLALPSAYGQDASFQSGVASWYGPWHHGKSTATGEAFDMFAMTAAHRTLPLGTLVKVEHKATGKSVIVRINDRGPYSKNRIIDLSYAAADSLGLSETGVSGGHGEKKYRHRLTSKADACAVIGAGSAAGKR